MDQKSQWARLIPAYRVAVYLLVLVVASGALSSAIFASETPNDQQVPAILLSTVMGISPALTIHRSPIESAPRRCVPLGASAVHSEPLTFNLEIVCCMACVKIQAKNVSCMDQPPCCDSIKEM